MASKGYTCLAHVTTHKNYEAITKNGSILNLYDRFQQKINTRGVFSYCDLDFEEPFRLFPGDFPGVYMSLVDDIEAFQKRELVKGNVVIQFPLELLQQSNWHYNLTDRCGAIGYDTYFPETFEQSPHSQDLVKYYGENLNEVIFHHSIPLCNASQRDLQLRMDLKRNCVFYSDRLYSGRTMSYYKVPEVTTTTDNFYIDFIRNELPVGFKHLCDQAKTKEELETILSNPDVFTFLHVRNQAG
jgi:hypothetical protein